MQYGYVYFYNIKNIMRFKNFAQCSAVQSRGSSAFQNIAVHCKLAICYTVKFNAVQGIELLCIIYMYKYFSQVHCMGNKCSVVQWIKIETSTVMWSAQQPTPHN